VEILVDTHTLIWWLEKNIRLSKRALALLASPTTNVLVSAAVGWELAIKANAGKFHSLTLINEFARLIDREGFAALPISLDHAIHAGLLPLHHRDPFDRILIAQAQLLNVSILSADAVLDRYGVRRVW